MKATGGRHFRLYCSTQQGRPDIRYRRVLVRHTDSTVVRRNVTLRLVRQSRSRMQQLGRLARDFVYRMSYGALCKAEDVFREEHDDDGSLYKCLVIAGVASGQTSESRAAALQLLLSDTPVVAFLNQAAACGMDVTGVSLVVHEEPPFGLESYRQGSGRANRCGVECDGTVCNCRGDAVLLAAYSDLGPLLSLQIYTIVKSERRKVAQGALKETARTIVDGGTIPSVHVEAWIGMVRHVVSHGQCCRTAQGFAHDCAALAGQLGSGRVLACSVCVEGTCASCAFDPAAPVLVDVRKVVDVLLRELESALATDNGRVTELQLVKAAKGPARLALTDLGLKHKHGAPLAMDDMLHVVYVLIIDGFIEHYVAGEAHGVYVFILCNLCCFYLICPSIYRVNYVLPPTHIRIALLILLPSGNHLSLMLNPTAHVSSSGTSVGRLKLFQVSYWLTYRRSGTTCCVTFTGR